MILNVWPIKTNIYNNLLETEPPIADAEASVSDDDCAAAAEDRWWRFEPRAPLEPDVPEELDPADAVPAAVDVVSKDVE